MVRPNICHLLAIIPWALGARILAVHAQSSPQPQRLCPASVLSRLIRHRAQPGESLASIAQRYGVTSATLKGINPQLRQGHVRTGANIVVPPYNGIFVAIPAGQTLKAVARAYQVNTEVLFELNGCQLSPKVAFVPGVSWSPSINSRPTGIAPLRSVGDAAKPSRLVDRQDRYPLPQPVPVIGTYGWRLNPDTRKMQFYSGVDLGASTGTPVYAVSPGTVVFAGKRGPSGQLVIIRHTQGRQTRYGRLGKLSVQAGQSVQTGTQLGTVGAVAPASLRFEVRYRSSLGWVAHDPQPYLQSLEK
ncbi:M23 family metallopeptidase [Acaryochloris sp. IP29b_bin.148]|uniref:LysM peptidoglycan-binding domain-containing M23 family metallopeptidase n=1 Tax=Acaryochloris sp. IP29b_bin.148 TaxID=2969218 RepID=UPI00260652F6|nr:M23 family metallopeptidase [Acaryochloris sp. IP29b_bin.148]